MRLALVVVVCAGLAAAINHWGHLGHGRDDLLAALRACLQLVVVGLLIAAVLGSWWLTLGFIILMLSVASLTAGKRLTPKGAKPGEEHRITGGGSPSLRSSWVPSRSPAASCSAA